MADYYRKTMNLILDLDEVLLYTAVIPKKEFGSEHYSVKQLSYKNKQGFIINVLFNINSSLVSCGPAVLIS